MLVSLALRFAALPVSAVLFAGGSPAAHPVPTGPRPAATQSTPAPRAGRVWLMNPTGVGVQHVTLDGRTYGVLGTGSTPRSAARPVGTRLLLVVPGTPGSTHATLDGRTYPVVP